MDPTLLARRAILAFFLSPPVARAARRYGMRLGAARFIAGPERAHALEAVRRLNQSGIAATLDYLGESVVRPEEAQATVDEYVRLLREIHAAGLDSNISVKLTSIGLSIRPDLALDGARRLVEEARRYGNFVRIDMEDTPYTDATLAIYRTLRREGFDNVGVVIQAYLYRSERDLEELESLGANVRLCKGAYREPPDRAFPQKARVDANYRKLAARRLRAGLYTGFATHDERAIAFVKEEARRLGVPRDRFEFQLLYGIRPDLQQRLAQEGYRVRVYVPYGTQWYPYFVRRLAERPANVGFVLRNLLRTG